MALNLTKLRPMSIEPRDEALSADTNDFLKWTQIVLNTLIGQQVTPGSGFGALQGPTINPTSSQLGTGGSRITSLSTKLSASAPSTTSIQVFWDGTNGSDLLRIYRDDGTIAGPFPNNQLVINLTANTLYFFFPYFDEATQRVLFVSQGGAVGSPPIAYTASSPLLLQQQSLRGRIPLSQLSISGFSTPAAGSTPGTSVGGGGGGGGIHLGSKL